MKIADVNIVFSHSYAVVGFHDKGSMNSIADAARKELNDGSQKFLKIVVANGLILLDDNPGTPSMTPKKYGAGTGVVLEDVWNVDAQLIVGTGDLRPTKTFTIETFDLTRG